MVRIMMSFHNKTVLITGGNRGIGKAAALKFNQLGCKKFALFARDQAKLKETANDLRNLGCQVLISKEGRDIKSHVAILEFCTKVSEEFGKIDILINNAGINRPGSVVDFDSGIWHEVFEVNVLGTLWFSHYALKHMPEGGAIINISSVLSLTVVPGMLPYCASKATINTITKQMALDLAPRNIRVNCIAPGLIDTEMPRQGASTLGDPDEVLKGWLQNYALKRMGKPEEVASLICYLASEDAGFMTGNVIPVEGGLLLSAEGGYDA